MTRTAALAAPSLLPPSRHVDAHTDPAVRDVAYEALKAAALSAGAAGRLPLVEMEAVLRHRSALRRATHQAIKARARPRPVNSR